MAQNNGFSLDFKGFLDYAEEIDELGIGDALLEVVKEAITETKDFVNKECESALNSSKYSFTEGEKYSQGKARASLEKVKQMPVEVNGTEVIGYAGFDLEDAPEVLPLAYGTPHLAKDKALFNAIKVKGGVKKSVEKLQSDIFKSSLAKLITEGGNG
jgi:hypothetical protein